jgi:hypothetical protein
MSIWPISFPNLFYEQHANKEGMPIILFHHNDHDSSSSGILATNNAIVKHRLTNADLLLI